MLKLADADMWAPDDCGWRLLHWAAAKGHATIVHLLGTRDSQSALSCVHWVSTEATVEDGECTALHLATQNNHCDAVAALIAIGANVNLYNSDNNTALHIFAQNNCVRCIDALICAGADQLALNDLQRTPLHVAAAEHACAAMQILAKSTAAYEMQCSVGNVPLHYVAQAGCKACVVNLLTNGANDTMCNSQGRTPLLLTSIGAHLDVVETLCAELRRKTHASNAINEQNRDGRSPLHYAVLAKHYKLALFMVTEGADLGLYYIEWHQPLHLAIEKRNKKLITLLLHFGAEILDGTVLLAHRTCDEEIINIVTSATVENERLKLLLDNGTDDVDWQRELVIGEYLGEGGFGKVYKASWKHGTVIPFVRTTNMQLYYSTRD